MQSKETVDDLALQSTPCALRARRAFLIAFDFAFPAIGAITNVNTDMRSPPMTTYQLFRERCGMPRRSGLDRGVLLCSDVGAMLLPLLGCFN